jgi:4-diphosphocytidyl-2-C-methyl-D-erythritol kinase
VALRLGADVPFFSAGHPAAVVTGIGEGLQPLPRPRPPAGALLITPAERLSTEAVFAELDRHPVPVSVAAERVQDLAGVLRGDVDGPTLAAASEMLHDANDLWAPAVRCSPALSSARRAAAMVLGHTVLLTGSGPTLLAVYPSVAAAEQAAELLQSERPMELEGALIQATSTAITGDRP